MCVRRYLIRLGPAETAARRINFAAVWNPCGSILAILAGRTIVFSGVEWTSCSCAEVESGATSCGLLVHLAPGSTAPCPAGSVESGCFVTPGSHGEPTRAERACSPSEVDAWRSEAAEATQLPYLGVSLAVSLAGLAVWRTSLPSYGGGAAAEEEQLPGATLGIGAQAQVWLRTCGKLLQVPRFRNGVIAQFFCAFRQP